MNPNRLTDAAAANRASNIGTRIDDEGLTEYLMESSPKELVDFMNKVGNLSVWFQRAKSILNMRLAENAAASAEAMVKQNLILVRESQALTKYTKGLYVLTAALVAFAIIQIVIMIIDYLKH